MPDPANADDPTISDAAVLWRRIPPSHVVLDQNLGRKRPTTDAFQDDPDGQPMSVAQAELCPNGPLDMMAAHPGFALAAFPASLARQCNQAVVRAPKPDEPWHAVVVGRKTDSVRKRLARNSTWEVPPA